MRGLFALLLAAIAPGALAQDTGFLPPFIHSPFAVVVDGAWQTRNVPLPDSADRGALEKLRDRAYRNGIVLQLRLDDDRSVKFVDEAHIGDTCDGQDGCRKHRLIGYWPTHRQYIVDVELWEGRQTYLVSEKDGRLLLVGSPPLLSPTGEYAIAVDNGVAYLNGGSELIDLRQATPKGVRLPGPPSCPGESPRSWLRPNPRWIDATHVVFEGLPPFGPAGDPTAKQILHVVDGEPEWEC